MYTGHFGLDDGPFHGKAEGEDVYVGPQQAVVVSRLRKALGTGDTAVAVSGPVGVGKTTLVRRAIADLAGRKIVISVDRIRLEPDEVLDLLLSRFDVSRQPKGTIQRVAAFRRLLQERLADDIRVFIVVEDAERVGVDALIELEALTATDAGEPVGANIVLMGDGELSSLLARPALARLRQRIRLRQVVMPFDAAEVEGYMRHCLEAAGGVLEQIFEPGTTRIVHRWSGGIARVVDNLCEAALAAAAEAGLATILPEFLQEVAANCGLEPQGADTDAAVGETAAAAPAADDATVDQTVDEAIDEVADEMADETLDDAPAEPPPADDEPEPAAAPPAPPRLALVKEAPVPVEAPVEDGPQLRQDPQAEWKARSASLTASRIDEVLPQLLERLQSSARGEPQASALALPPVAPADDNGIPTLSNSMRIAVLPVHRPHEQPPAALDVGDDEVSPEAHAAALEADPEPDLPQEPPAADAASFELAIAADDSLFLGALDTEESDDEETTEAATLSIDEVPTFVPDPITGAVTAESEAGIALEPEVDALEAAIQAANAWQASETIDAAGEQAAAAPPDEVAADLPEITLDAELEKQKPSPTEQLDQWAEELSQAKSLEDISDILAETIFGNAEIEAISAGIRAMKAKDGKGKDGKDKDGKDKDGKDKDDKARASKDTDNNDNKAGDRTVENQKAADRKAADGTAAGPTAVPPPKAAPARPHLAPSRPTPSRAPARPVPSAPRPSPAGPARAPAGGISMTMSQRIQMVNSLKGRKSSQPLKPLAGMPVAEIVLAEQPDGPPPKAAGNAPAPIEAQIDTAITQSRKALSEADLARMASSPGRDDSEADDGDRKGSRGLFGFFRRSTKR